MKRYLILMGLIFWSMRIALAADLPAAPQAADQAAPGAGEAAKPAAEARPNTAVIPQLNQGFMGKHNAYVELAKKGDIEVLFMGDSITDFWRNAGKSVLDKNFGELKLANFGIAGDTTQGVLWRLQNGEGQGYQPKAIMLMIGTNNTGRNTAPEIAEGVTAVVKEIRKDFPDAKILLLAIFPRKGPMNAVSKIAEINPIISKLDDGKHVFYLDIGPKFLDADGAIPVDVMRDGLHPTTKGYEIWAEAVKEPLAKLLKTDGAASK